MASKKFILAFDVYGTLLSTDSIAKKLAAHFGEEKGKSLATTWRKYQLEYTWRANSMGVYFDFSVITRRSLRHTLAESGLQLDDNQTDDMMKSYDSLSTFSDVNPTIEKLKDFKDVKVVVFSNGTHDMVSRSINNSPDLSPNASIFEDIIVVDDCRRYKPATEAYSHLAVRMGKDIHKSSDMDQVWLVSGNPFDISGARAMGMNAIWVDRAGAGWTDALLPNTARNLPNEIVKSLDEVVAVMRKAVGKTR